ncbi:SusC/RagA family TonB-linked outer membrane protein [Pedobacter aquae]|uniref:SusC/RagA family TonB-linked outer membrane protein n=1 Tax=Pedobacter aquae TaxID=2605747 RepID=A0A5C0VKQ3_9SPHI|nr:SusC/RagA family TonB-linked outer membrane protein [Pedobacter aquae]QEK52283.1 SusC/RagA family TonB-linked outer membrane protein [Pedobacter aquae]
MNEKCLPRSKKVVKTKGISLLFLSFFLIIFNTLSAFAQTAQITVKGKLLGEDDGQPIIGVIITDNNKKNLGTTNFDGEFSINVPKNTTVTFSYIGYEPTRMTFANSQSNLTIRLKVSTTALNEVVVTALGIKREEKALGYATTTVKGEDLTSAISNNWTDALSGKVAGLNLVRSNGGPTGSNKIILRGENNLTGENDALIVVDGVVINQGSGRSTGTGGSGYLSSETPVDFGSGLNDINPEDIESVTVLKGPGAAALYGQRGANGAIIITTKSGMAKKKGLGVTFTSNTSLEQINRWPDLQYEYGQGVDGDNYYSYNASEDGPSTRSTSSAWGPRFNGQMFYQYDPVTHTKSTTRTPWIPYVNDSRRFFDEGRTFTNSVTLDGAGEKTSARFSYTNVNNKWIIPNTGYGRNTVALSVTQKMNDKLQIVTKVNYTNKFSDNLPSTGYNNQSIMYWYLFWVPSASVDWLKDYWLPGRENRNQSFPFSSFPDNPYLIANQMLNKSNRNGLTGNVQATYNFTKDLSLMVRTSLDMAQEQRSQQRPFDTEKFKRGMYRTQNINSQEVNSDFLLRYNKKINKKFAVSGSVGGSVLKNNYNRDELRADSLSFPGLFTLANAAGVLEALPNRSKYAINSFYGLFTASFKDYLYLDVTARKDWSSTLATPTSVDNADFFYPSFNLSFVLSEAFKLPEAISFAKLRTSFAGVGSGSTQAYRNSYNYFPENIFAGGLVNPTTLPNLNLQSLYTQSFEIGADVRLFKNRLSFDVAVYQGETRDQILSSVVDASSGYRFAEVNLGVVSNKGVEIAINGSPLKSKNGLNWNIFGTFSANRNTVESLPNDLPQVLQNGPGSRGSITANIGGSLGDLYGRGYERAPDGQIIYENGYPVLTQDAKYIGNTIPQWRASVGNNFKYKNFSFNVLLDGQYGAKAYSLSAAVLAEQGKTVNTLPGRYNGIIGNGVIRNTDGTFRKNDVIAQDPWTYYTAHYGRDNVEGTSYSTDFIKIREARLDYSLPIKVANKVGLQRITLGIYGRDLFTFSAWPIFDPEFGTLSGSEINRGFEYGQFPSTRTLGFNLVIGI